MEDAAPTFRYRQLPPKSKKKKKPQPPPPPQPEPEPEEFDWGEAAKPVLRRRKKKAAKPEPAPTPEVEPAPEPEPEPEPDASGLPPEVAAVIGVAPAPAPVEEEKQAAEEEEKPWYAQRKEELLALMSRLTDNTTPAVSGHLEQLLRRRAYSEYNKALRFLHSQAPESFGISQVAAYLFQPPAFFEEARFEALGTYRRTEIYLRMEKITAEFKKLSDPTQPQHVSQFRMLEEALDIVRRILERLWEPEVSIEQLEALVDEYNRAQVVRDLRIKRQSVKQRRTGRSAEDNWLQMF